MPSHPKITDAMAQRFRAEKGQQIDHFDQQYPGLALRVSHRRKVWSVVDRLHGKQRRIWLGLYPSLTVAQAHDEWRRVNIEIQNGRDPAPKMMPSSSAPSTKFAAVFADWMAKDQAKNRSAGIVRRSIERDVLPHWLGRDIASIGRRDCHDIIDRVAADRPIEARRLHARLHRLFKWSLGRGIVTVNPMAAIEKQGSEEARERALSDAELLKVWQATAALGDYGKAVRLLALTGARRDEIGALRWSEIAGVDGPATILLPGSRTKNGEAHAIPLSAAAQTVLATIKPIEGSDFVFGKGGITSWSTHKARLNESAPIASWHLHDLRRTLATGLQRIGTPLVVTESILGHVSGSRAGIVKVYQVHDYLPEKTAALEAWGAHIMALVHGTERGKVVPFLA